MFLPGAGEIDRLARHLRNSTHLKRAAEGLGFLVLPLHGSLAPDHQVRGMLKLADNGWWMGVSWPMPVSVRWNE